MQQRTLKDDSLKSAATVQQAEEKKPQSVPVVTAVQRAYLSAADCYTKEDRSPWAKSKLGGRFGLFSMFRHGALPSGFGHKILIELKEAKGDEVEKACIQLLKENGSLFDSWISNNHSFTNYFLYYLRHEYLPGYKDLISKTYGLTFIPDEAITLYRKDTRYAETIFAEGFQLKEGDNKYSTRKYKYKEPYTQAHGVSLSYSNYAISHFSGSLYTVILPKGHSLLLIDICASACNANRLDSNRITLQEVNSMDPIPREYIYCNDQGNNKSFSHEPVAPSRTWRGCY